MERESEWESNSKLPYRNPIPLRFLWKVIPAQEMDSHSNKINEYQTCLVQ